MNLLNIFALSGLANFFLSIGFGILVYFKNKKESINFAFLLLSLSVAIWSLGYYFWLNATNKETAIFWLKILSSASVLIPIVYFHWVLILLKQINKQIFKLLLVVFYLIGFIIISIIFIKTHLVIADVKIKLIFPYWPDAGPLYSFYILVIYIGLVTSSIILISKNFFIQKDRITKTNFLVLIIGAILAFGGGFTNFFYGMISIFYLMAIYWLDFISCS